MTKTKTVTFHVPLRVVCGPVINFMDHLLFMLQKNCQSCSGSPNAKDFTSTVCLFVLAITSYILDACIAGKPRFNDSFHCFQVSFISLKWHFNSEQTHKGINILLAAAKLHL